MKSDLEPKLQPGVGFHLKPDGQWEVKKIPLEVLQSAKMSGLLTIQGYRSTVFETPDKEQWAQKSVIAPTIASNVAARFLESQNVNVSTQRIRSSEVSDSIRKDIIDNFRIWSANDPSKWVDEIPYWADYFIGTDEGSSFGLSSDQVRKILETEFMSGQIASRIIAPVQETVASRVAARYLVAVVSITPEELLKTLYGQIQSYDLDSGDFVRCSSPEIRALVESVRSIFASHGVTNFADQTGRADLPEVVDSDAIKLVADMMFIDGEDTYAVEKAPPEISDKVNAISSDIYSALGDKGDSDIQEISPFYPSDPTKTLFWNGSSFSDRNSVLASNKSLETVASRVAARYLEAKEKVKLDIPVDVEIDPKSIAEAKEKLKKFEEQLTSKKVPHEASVASRVAVRYLEAKGRKRDVTSLVKKIMDRPGDDQNYEKEISRYGKKVRKVIPKVEAAFEKLSMELQKVSSDLSEASHEKVSGHHASKIQDEVGKAISTTQVAASALIRNLLKRADEWDPED